MPDHSNSPLLAYGFGALFVIALAYGTYASKVQELEQCRAEQVAASSAIDPERLRKADAIARDILAQQPGE